jgi:hypothetical protein
MIYRPTDTFDLTPLWGPELHDLTGPHGCSLLPVAAEMRERDALRRARAARWSRSWLRRAAGAVRSVLQRRDRPPVDRQAANRGEVAVSTWKCEAADLSSVYEALTHARLVARRAGQTELADALHALFLLDLTGNLADVAPLVASVRASLQSALGDDPGAVN